MSFYEHTFVGKQDISDKDVNNLVNECSEIIKNLENPQNRKMGSAKPIAQNKKKKKRFICPS